MPISERTRQEMLAGASALAGNGFIEPAHMDMVLRTVDRHAQLLAWESEGRIRIDKHAKDQKRWLEISVGPLTFDSRRPEYQAGGAYPSELMFAQIALALEAKQDKKEPSKSEPPF